MTTIPAPAADGISEVAGQVTGIGEVRQVTADLA
jgi:hypothetical protein